MRLNLALTPGTKVATVKTLLILCFAQRHWLKTKDAQPSAQPVARHLVMCLCRSEEKWSKQLAASARPEAAACDNTQSAQTRLSSIDSDKSVAAVIWALPRLWFHTEVSGDTRGEKGLCRRRRIGTGLTEGTLRLEQIQAHRHTEKCNYSSSRHSCQAARVQMLGRLHSPSACDVFF